MCGCYSPGIKGYEILALDRVVIVEDSDLFGNQTGLGRTGVCVGVKLGPSWDATIEVRWDDIKETWAIATKRIQKVNNENIEVGDKVMRIHSSSGKLVVGETYQVAVANKSSSYISIKGVRGSLYSYIKNLHIIEKASSTTPKEDELFDVEVIPEKVKKKLKQNTLLHSDDHRDDLCVSPSARNPDGEIYLEPFGSGVYINTGDELKNLIDKLSAIHKKPCLAADL
ncbi:MAG: hypothetical protein AAF696_33845 [Bacteroidota bacterium]